jgi:hypothetical protein
MHGVNIDTLRDFGVIVDDQRDAGRGSLLQQFFSQPAQFVDRAIFPAQLHKIDSAVDKLLQNVGRLFLGEVTEINDRVKTRIGQSPHFIRVTGQPIRSAQISPYS